MQEFAKTADWSVLRDQADIAVFQDRLADANALIERLLPIDVVCVMRERTLRIAVLQDALRGYRLETFRKWLDT